MLAQAAFLSLPEGETLFYPWFFQEFAKITFLVGAGYFWACFADGAKRAQRMAEFRIRAASAFVCFLCLYIIITLFAGWKSLIGYINPFHWDPTFIALEKKVHFGWYPQLALSFLYDWPAVVWLLDQLYSAWFVVIYFYLAFQLFADPRRVSRARFLCAFGLVWVVAGTVLAICFASVGPVFLDDYYTISHPFGDVNERLAVLGSGLIKSTI